MITKTDLVILDKLRESVLGSQIHQQREGNNVLIFFSFCLHFRRAESEK